MDVQEEYLSKEERDVAVALEGKQALRKTLTAGQWYFVNMLGQKIFVFGTFFITARLLTPADFGIIAIAGIYPAFIDALTALSFESVLVQKKAGEEKHYLNVVWTFSVLRAFTIFSIVFFSAPFITHYFHAEGYLLLFRLSGLLFLIQGLGNIGNIYFFRNLDFKKVFFRDLALQSTSSVLSIMGAIYLHSYWALFIGNTAGVFAAALSTYVLHPYRPSFDFNFTKLKPLFGYTRWIFGQDLLNQSAKTLEDTLVGRFATPTNIGIFSKAKGLSHVVTSPLSSIIGKISFSTFSQIQDSHQHVREGIYKTIDLLAGVALPFLVAIIIAGHRLILVLLGPQWVDMYQILILLTIIATLDTVIISLGRPIFNALGKPQFTFTTNAVYLGILIAFLPILVPLNGTFGAATALLMASIASSIITLILINKLVHLKWSRIIETIAVISLGIALPIPLCYYLLQFPFAYQTIGFLLLGVLIGICYFSVLIFIGKKYDKGPYRTYLVIANSFLRTNFLTNVHKYFHKIN